MNHLHHDPHHAAAPGPTPQTARGYTLVASPTVPTGAVTDFRFQVRGPDGAPHTAYTPSHDKDLHLIAVRHDLSHFQHVHPVLEPVSGDWSVPLSFQEPGPYRVFADFVPTHDPDGPLTLAADVVADGAYTPDALPAAAAVAEADGYTVVLRGTLETGRATALTLSVARDGTPVTDLQPYLAAYGHLVALRVSDLAYLHVHPEGAPGDGHTASGPDIVFHVQAPSADAYRLFLDFQHEGRVRTAEFTVEAREGAPAAQDGHHADHDHPHH